MSMPSIILRWYGTMSISLHWNNAQFSQRNNIIWILLCIFLMLVSPFGRQIQSENEKPSIQAINEWEINILNKWTRWHRIAKQQNQLVQPRTIRNMNHATHLRKIERKTEEEEVEKDLYRWNRRNDYGKGKGEKVLIVKKSTTHKS